MVEREFSLNNVIFESFFGEKAFLPTSSTVDEILCVFNTVEEGDGPFVVWVTTGRQFSLFLSFSNLVMLWLSSQRLSKDGDFSFIVWYWPKSSFSLQWKDDSK